MVFTVILLSTIVIADGPGPGYEVADFIKIYFEQGEPAAWSHYLECWNSVPGTDKWTGVCYTKYGISGPYGISVNQDCNQACESHYFEA
ncbi:MAG: hypothetical protein V2A62_03565 [Candidatus Woesearchaeota archaeon]